MKIIFFGLGSIGQRHARLILKNFNHSLFAYRSGKQSKPNNLGIKEVHSWREVADLSPDAAFITNPSFLHIDTAIKCAEMGMRLFIEKPLCSKLSGLDRLMRIVKEKKLPAYVAYCLRFHPIIEYLHKYIKNKEGMHARVVVSSYLPAWRKNQAYFNTYSARNEQGGGVILDLSHEIDYSWYLFGDILEMAGISGKISDLKINTQDYADIIMKCRKSIVNVHLNFFSKNIERKIIIDFPDSNYIEADFIKNTLLAGKGKTKKIYRYNLGRDDIYVKQLKYFFKNYNNAEMMNNLVEAAELSKIILGFKESNEKN